MKDQVKQQFYKIASGDSILIKYFEALGVETKFIEQIVLTKIKDFPIQNLNLNLIDSLI